jgi:hypothetical protein
MAGPTGKQHLHVRYAYLPSPTSLIRINAPPRQGVWDLLQGAAYTGLKPAGADFGPVIPAAEHAVATGDLAKLRTVLAEEIERALGERLANVRELQKAPLEPKTVAELPHARERISAELAFVTFAESVRQAILGKGAEHHKD